VLNFTELITHPVHVNIKSFSVAEHISIALPKQLWLKTDSKPFHAIFLIRTADFKEFFSIRFWTELWKSISQIPNIAKVLIVNDMFKYFYIVYLGLNSTAIYFSVQ